jgi:hypothetical protein
MRAGRVPGVVPTDPQRPVRCRNCGRWVEVCAFCVDPACANVICYRCLRGALRQSLDQPHRHGG